MEVMCNTTHRKDKWLEHCKKKHAYKFRHTVPNLNISFKMVQSFKYKCMEVMCTRHNSSKRQVVRTL